MTPMLLLLAETPSPAPTPTEMELWEVTPGIEGFVLGFFVLALACIPLFRSMIKHMRKVDHNQRVLERAEAEEAEHATPDPDGGRADVHDATGRDTAADRGLAADLESSGPQAAKGTDPAVSRPGQPASSAD